jgi:hypothetical protein
MSTIIQGLLTFWVSMSSAMELISKVKEGEEMKEGATSRR